MNYAILLLFATCIALLPIIFIKYYIKTNKYIYLCLALICYILLLISYIKIFRTGQEISTIYIILQILQILIVFIVGILLFSEKINKNKIIGSGLGILSIYLLLKK
jgi:multidrug transporter EmrE-like cation transporter